MSVPPTTLLARFRVYPGRVGGLYYMVYVWPTKRAMQYWVKAGINGAGNTPLVGRRGDFKAICCSNTTLRIGYRDNPNRVARRLPLLGQIHFYKDSLRMGIICHESGHAALAYCDRMKIDFNEQPQKVGCASEGEEGFCWALGNIARQIVVGTAKKKLIA